MLKTSFNIPLVLMLSVIPDIDIPFSGLQILEHRGPTHSIVVAFIIFIPIFFVYRKRATPYFIALIQHSLVGDYIAGGRLQLLWPFTTQYYGMSISIRSQTNIALEWALFLAAMAITLRTREILTFFQPHNSNLILIVPLCTVLLPTFIAVPLEVPLLLVPPHVTYLILFIASILIDARKILRFLFSSSKEQFSAKNPI